jgi:hypothetical protein
MLVYQYKVWQSGVLQSERLIDNRLLTLPEVQEKNPYVTKIYLEAIIYQEGIIYLEAIIDG